jgi:hypothetical protein
VSGCTEECWTPSLCEHGREMTPRGRSVAIEAYVVCECYRDINLNPVRHLWHEHDSTRHYIDPEGWAAHEATCEQCSPLSEG